MPESSLAPWSNFFMAEATAAATLAGLLFVAVSINLTRILAFAHLPGRAAEVLGSFVVIVLISTLGLVPGQSDLLFGAEILVMTLPLAWLSVSIQRRSKVSFAGRRLQVAARIVLAFGSALLLLLAGALLLFRNDHGLYVLALGMSAYIVFSVLNCWVLLVEIMR